MRATFAEQWRRYNPRNEILTGEMSLTADLAKLRSATNGRV